MKTQRAPFTQAEYCLIPITHKVSPVKLRAPVDIRKTFESYGWKPTPKDTKHG